MCRKLGVGKPQNQALWRPSWRQWLDRNMPGEDGYGAAPNGAELAPLSEQGWPGAKGLPGDQGPSVAVHQLSPMAKSPCPCVPPAGPWDGKSTRPPACLSARRYLPLKGQGFGVPPGARALRALPQAPRGLRPGTSRWQLSAGPPTVRSPSPASVWGGPRPPLTRPLSHHADGQ